MDTDPAARFVIISGCSGGGKSTLIDELAKRGHAVVEEPGRRIIADERARGGTALPWIDLIRASAMRSCFSRKYPSRIAPISSSIF